MGLFVYDSTRRIITPLAVDLQRRTIQQLSPTAAVSPIRPESSEVTRSAGLWRQTYQQTQEQTKNQTDSSVPSRLTAFDVMTPTIVTLHENGTWQQARQLFQAHDIHHLVLINDESLATGLLLERDLLDYPDSQRTVEPLPKRPLLSATPETDIHSIAFVMLNRNVDAVLVLSGQTIEGIVTLKDLLKAFTPRSLVRNEA